MPTILERAQLPALARGLALLGSGGGGATTLLELALADASRWPIEVYGIDELDASSPCLTAAFVGSTMLLGERLPGVTPFAPLIAAAERWLGHDVPTVCSMEGGGVNGLTPFALAGERVIVDADLSGRAVPSLDQMSLLVDRVPGVIATCDTGAGGVMLVQTDRPVDLERVIRSAIVQAGGVGGAVFAGFTVGDLVEHAIPGNVERALMLGVAFTSAMAAPVDELADALGARLLGHGRITAVEADERDPFVNCVDVAGMSGQLHRIITRSETLAFMTDGEVQTAAPAIIVVLDAVSREILEVTQLTLARTIVVLEIPAPQWWYARPHRLAHIVPSVYGLEALDGAA